MKLEAKARLQAAVMTTDMRASFLTGLMKSLGIRSSKYTLDVNNYSVSLEGQDEGEFKNLLAEHGWSDTGKKQRTLGAIFAKKGGCLARVCCY